VAAIAPTTAPAAAGVRPASGARAGSRGQKFHEVLSRQTIGQPPQPQDGLAQGAIARVEEGRRRLDEIIAQARAGKTFKPRELLALQAEMYRISEELSLVNKVVEEGVAGVKRLWNMQV
jgi:hypothetical protein